MPNGRLLWRIYGTFGEEPLMAVDLRACLPIFLAVTAWLFFPQSEAASDDLPRSSRVGPLKLPLVSYERVAIATVVAHPDRYQMRDIRIAGTITAIRTETITTRMICGSAHEQTTLMVEDDSGEIEIIDRGGCGKNVGALKAPMLKTGQQIDLLVQIMIPISTGSSGLPVEATIRYIDLARE